MASRIITKKGSGAPLASDLVHGELAVDTVNKRLYTEDAGGTVVEVGTAPSTIDINGGTIDGTVIGGTTAAAGSFTTFTSTGIDDNATSTAITIDASENVGIGTSSPSSALTTISGSSADETVLTIGNDYSVADTAGDAAGVMFQLYRSYSPSVNDAAFIKAVKEQAWDETGDRDSALVFGTRDGAAEPTERLRIDSSGNLGLGVTPSAWAAYKPYQVGWGALASTSASQNTLLSSNVFFDGVTFKYIGTGTASYLQQFEGSFIWKTAPSGTAGNAISFSEAMRIDSSGNVGIGTSSPDDKLDIEGADPAIRLTDTSAVGFARMEGLNGSLVLQSDEGNTVNNSIIKFDVDGAEAMRIDSSGTVSVGTIDSNVVNNSGDTPGINLGAGGNKGSLAAARYEAPPLALNRLGDDGTIATFRRDSETVGSIGVIATDRLYLQGGTSSSILIDGYLGPGTGNGSLNDNVMDCGIVSARWNDVYATNGTIQTSDRNEKQDIEELSEAEQRVAVAAKGLLRKFRWKSAVEEKGEDARVHFGIIAQDLQAAFEAEGLDAGRYAMFIHSTWTDEETGEERNRMGVRYSELLAFIIAAI